MISPVPIDSIFVKGHYLIAHCADLSIYHEEASEIGVAKGRIECRTSRECKSPTLYRTPRLCTLKENKMEKHEFLPKIYRHSSIHVCIGTLPSRLLDMSTQYGITEVSTKYFSNTTRRLCAKLSSISRCSAHSV